MPKKKPRPRRRTSQVAQKNNRLETIPAACAATLDLQRSRSIIGMARTSGQLNRRSPKTRLKSFPPFPKPGWSLPASSTAEPKTAFPATPPSYESDDFFDFIQRIKASTASVRKRKRQANKKNKKIEKRADPYYQTTRQLRRE